MGKLESSCEFRFRLVFEVDYISLLMFR